MLFFIIAFGTLHAKSCMNKNDNSFKIIELSNKKGNKIGITNYGARLVSWYVKDNKNKEQNIVLGFSSQEQYEKAAAPYYGAIVGRYANRIENFTLYGKEYHLTDDAYVLHGGKAGFHDKLWTIEVVSDSSVTLSYISKDGDGGYQGQVTTHVEYILTSQNELVINYSAATDKPTPINLTNHAFFNLKGAGNGSILDLSLKVNADQFTPLQSNGLPTGEIKEVEGSVFDFRNFKKVKSAVKSKDPQILLAKGLDHNFVNKNTNEPLITAIDPKSGIKMEMTTTMAGVQIYTANYLSGKDKNDKGKAFKARESICFESQFFANSPNHSNFPNTILKPGETYSHSTVYKVTTLNSVR